MLNTILAAAVLVLIFGFFVLRLIFAGRIKNTRRGIIIIPCSGETENLSSLVKSYYWEEIFEGEDNGKEIVIVLMDGSLNCAMAKLLSEQYSIVSWVYLNELEDFLKNRENSESVDGKGNKDSRRG